MVLKNLLPFSKNQPQEPDTFFAAEITNESTKVAVWHVSEGMVEVIRTGDVINVEGNTYDDFLRALDMAIATATVEGEQEPDKVIFGLPDDWVDDKGILAAKRGLLKYLTTKLEIKPVGFVVIADALITYLKQKQGTPPSALFIRFQKTELSISLVHLGKTIVTEKVGRSGDVVADVKEGLMRLKKQEQLPPRVILYDGYLDFEDIKQQLLSQDWEKELPFLHTPAIEGLNKEISVEAVAVAGGQEAAKLLGMETAEEEVQTDTVTPPQASDQEAQQPADEADEKAEAAPVEELPPGFTVASTQEIVAQQEEVPQPQTEEENQLQETEVPAESAEISMETAEVTSQKSRLATSFSGIAGRVKNLKLPSFSKKPGNQVVDDTVVPVEVDGESEVESTTKKKLPLWVFLGGGVLLLFGLIGGSVYAYYNVPKATVSLTIKPIIVEKETTIKLSSATESADLESFIVPGSLREMTVDGSETVPTTGTKRVGEKAKGKVTVYNKTDKSKTFGAGTVLVGPGNLRYVLDEEVKVASRSAESTGDGEKVTFGKAEANVTAGEIGEEYNLDSGKEFTFKDFDDSDYSAKNTDSISGGNSSSVKSISKEDRQKALEALEEKLEADAIQKLKTEVGEAMVVFESSAQSELGETTFDGKAGEEAEAVTVEGDMTVEVLVAGREDFDTVITRALAASIPAEYAVSSDGLEIEVTTVEPDEDEETLTTVTVKAKAKLLPKFDFQAVKQTVAGKDPKDADEFFKSLTGVNGTSILISPHLPGVLATMPHKAEKIVITTTETQ